MNRSFTLWLCISLLVHVLLLTMSYLPSVQDNQEAQGLLVTFGKTHPKTSSNSNALENTSDQRHQNKQDGLSAKSVVIPMPRFAPRKNEARIATPSIQHDIVLPKPYLNKKNKNVIMSDIDEYRDNTSFVASDHYKSRGGIHGSTVKDHSRMHAAVRAELERQIRHLKSAQNMAEGLPGVKEEFEPTSFGHELGNTRVRDAAQDLGYSRVIALWLDRFRYYPEEARKQKLEGDADLFIKINREGEILRWDIVRSTGYKILDDELMAMVRRVPRVIKVPADYRPNEAFLSYKIKFIFDLEEWEHRHGS